MHGVSKVTYIENIYLYLYINYTLDKYIPSQMRLIRYVYVVYIIMYIHNISRFSSIVQTKAVLIKNSMQTELSNVKGRCCMALRAEVTVTNSNRSVP